MDGKAWFVSSSCLKFSRITESIITSLPECCHAQLPSDIQVRTPSPSYTLEIKGCGTTVFLHRKYTGKSRTVQSDQIQLKSPEVSTLKVLQCWKEAQPAYHLQTATPTHIIPTVTPVTCLNDTKSDQENRLPLKPVSCWRCSINSLINKCMSYLQKH